MSLQVADKFPLLATPAPRRLVDILSDPSPTAYFGNDAGMNDRPLQFNGNQMSGEQGKDDGIIIFVLLGMSVFLS